MSDLYHALLNYMITHIGLFFWILAVLGFCSLLSNAIPTPVPDSPTWYVVFYAIVHTLSLTWMRLWYVVIKPRVTGQLEIEREQQAIMKGEK